MVGFSNKSSQAKKLVELAQRFSAAIMDYLPVVPKYEQRHSCSRSLSLSLTH